MSDEIKDVGPSETASGVKQADLATQTSTEAMATPTNPLLKELQPAEPRSSQINNLDMILDIPVQLTVELGRTKIAVRDLLQLVPGSVVELDSRTGTPMDVLVNGCLVAQGEVVVVNEKFGLRLTDIITPEERLRRLQK